MKKFLALLITLTLVAGPTLADGPTDFSGTASTAGVSFPIQKLTQAAQEVTTYVSCVDDAITVVPHVHDKRTGLWTVVYLSGSLSGAVTSPDSLINIPANMIVPITGKYHALLIKNATAPATVYVHKYKE